MYVPMLFRKYGSIESTLYIPNLSSTDPANVAITFYDEDTGFYCTMDKVVQPGASRTIWLAGLDNTVYVSYLEVNFRRDCFAGNFFASGSQGQIEKARDSHAFLLGKGFFPAVC